LSIQPTFGSPPKGGKGFNQRSLFKGEKCSLHPFLAKLAVSGKRVYSVRNSFLFREKDVKANERRGRKAKEGEGEGEGDAFQMG